ncbi:MAG: PocR ligand-binding domain-containing protein, partial [Desulfuromonadaceae bacterium]|nr:PocR ligand-binding domain-containing protein [Desulfuromonadaceae bacterium]
LESILSPEGEIGNLELADIIDVPAIQALMDDFYKLAPMPMAILDLKGKVLVGKGWQDICTKFHRTHPVASRNCLESDLKLTTDIPPGEFKLYKCKNNMWDVATPIMVGDVHVGNLFSGQFFFDDEPLDYELFKSQAERYGFKEDEYIAALECVPHLSREFLATGMDFLTKFAAIISKLSYGNIKLARSLTERDALTTSLSESELFYRQTLESIPGMVFTTRPDGYCDYQSQQWVDFTGVPMSEHIGDGWNRLLHPDDRPRAYAAWFAAVQERAPYDLEYRVRRHDGVYEWFKVRGRPIRNAAGEIVRWFGTALNIDHLLKTQEALRSAHDELEQRVAERTVELAETVETLLREMSVRERAETNLLRLNRLYAVLGEINQAIVRASDRDSLFSDFCRIAVEQGGFLLSWVGLVDKEESTRVKSVAAYGAICYLEDIHISANEEPVETGPTAISIREGTYYICNDFLNDPCTRPWHERGRTHGIKASASVALKEEGRVIGALSLYAGEKDFFDRQQEELLVQMGADVSFALDNMAREARRQMVEQALREETLERLRAVEAMRDNEKMLLQQSRLAAMGEMINNIAHQWRQPLNVLALLVQQIQLFYDTGSLSKEELDSCVNKSMGSINHMSQTIDDFRNFFKPDKKQVVFKIQDVVAKTITLVEDSFKNQQIRIDLRVSDNPTLTGFPNEYSQVLLNIMTNARDALLEKRPNGAKVTITICKEEEKAVVIIADNAGGIPEEVMDKIFEPYFTTKGPDKGTGVGLFMSKTIIEKNMNGCLKVRNTPEGAEFRIEV